MSTDTSSRHLQPVVFPAVGPAGESEGWTRGHAAGYAVGLRRAAEELAVREAELADRHAATVAAERARTDRAVAVLDAAARALQARTEPVLADADAQLVAAGLAIAEAVLGCELSDAPRAARAALARGLSAPDSDAALRVRLNPDDVALLQDSTIESPVELVADATLDRGDAVAVYPDGELDARIRSALSRARAALPGEDS